MKTIIINGANGYVAANFINKLLSKNHYRIIALVRASNKYSAEERMIKALTENNNGEKVDARNITVYNYSLLDKDFSIPEEQLKDIFKQEVDYFHFAASLKYDLRSRDEIFKTNIEGVENSIKVYSKYAQDRSRFFLIGTAYSCGKFLGLFEEKFYPDEDISGFRNYYEQSKRISENMIKKQNENNGLNGHIIRLSQVVGNNKSGITKTDYGIFDFAKRIHNLATRYPNKTVRVQMDPESTQNLIPVDTVADYLTRTVEINRVPVIMNFIGNNSIKNNYIIDSINKLIPINIIPTGEIKPEDMNAIEKVIAAGMSFTSHYVNTNLAFDTKKRDEIITSNGNEASEHTVFKMLEYFINNIPAKNKKTKIDSYS